MSASQKREAKLARILVMIVFFFLICNMPKIASNIFDIINIREVETCMKMDLQFRFPTWLVITNSLNHLLAVSKSLYTSQYIFTS